MNPIVIESVEPILARVGHRNQLLVKLVAESGLVGWGESGLSGREWAVQGALNHFAPLVKGKDARQISRLWQELYRSHYFEGGRVITAALSALDIALYDLLGKSVGLPVYQLLGGRQRDTVPCFACCYTEAAPERFDELRSEVMSLIEAGFTTIRVIPADFDQQDIYDPEDSLVRTARCLNELRQAIGPDIRLGIDFHHRLSVAQTVSFCQRLNAGVLDFIEEPIRDECPQTYQTLRAMVSVPFAIGEEFSSKWQALPYIEAGITQYMRIDVCNIGGFTEAMKVAAMAEAHYVDVMPHNPLGPVCTAASNHLALAIPNFSLMETHQGPNSIFGSHDSQIFTRQHRLQGCCFKVPELPGLGVEINEQQLRAAEPLPSEAPHLSRPDGGVTNW